MKFSGAKLAKASGTLGLAALAAITSPYATAEDAGWYVGASGGPTKATIDDARISNSLIGGGFQSSTIADDDRSTGYKLFGGYQFNPNFSLEGGYFDLGKFGFTATTVPAGTLSGNMKIRGLNLDAVGTVPLSEKFSAFGRIGVNYAETNDTFAGAGAVSVSNPNPTKRDTNYKFGVGLQYAFTESLALRTEVERYRINDAVGNKGDIDHLSIGLVYRFGGKTKAPIAYAAAPQPVAKAPEPTVIAEVAPPPPPPPPPPPIVPIKVTFSADSLFDFNHARIKPAGQQGLDQFAADLKGVQFEVINVTGHSDRIGSHAYNMKLSAQRAEAVRDYLVQSAGIPTEKIVTKGVNGADPVTKPGDCVGPKQGKKPSMKLIACLQPDRRVEVEVVGTK
jgi:OOP family OmpA-OmpF porin